MSRRFIKRPDLHIVTLPGIGRVSTTQMLEGDQWARFCPTHLVEILDSTPVQEPVREEKPMPAGKPELLTEVMPVPRPDDFLTDETPVKKAVLVEDSKKPVQGSSKPKQK